MSLGTLTIEHIVQSNLIEGVKNLDEVQKSVKAWKFLQLLEPKELTDQSFLDVHKLIMDGLLRYHVGVYRPYNVEVGGRLCPHYDDVPRLMAGWVPYFKFNFDIETPKTMHIQFEHIHPFVDGNGRVGRLMMWWHEVKRGIPPTLISYDERSKYYDCF